MFVYFLKVFVAPATNGKHYYTHTTHVLGLSFYHFVDN